MKIIRYAGLEYKQASEPTHLYHVEREGSHYLLYYRGGGSLSYDAKMTGTPGEVDAAFDQEVEYMESGAYHNENWQVATETPDAHAQKILGIFEHPTFGIKWEKTGGGQSSEDQFCDMLEKQVKEWKGSAHALSVARHPYWPKFHAMVKDAVSKEYGSSIRLYRGVRGEQALPILDGVPSKNRGATAWTSDLSSARVYAAGKTKRGDADWVVVRRSFSPEEILLAPVMLDGPCENPDILMRLARDVEHYGDEWIVNLPEFIPGDFKIVARPRGMKSESLLREYIRELLVEAAKTPLELAELQDAYVIIQYEGSSNTRIFIGDKTGDAWSYDDHDHGIHGGVYIEKIDPRSPGKAGGPCGDAWMVTTAGAKKGWGPLLYDVAIEYATLNGGGLVSDRGIVSGKARAVWDYYMNNRPDITAHQLDDLQDTLTPEYEDNCLQTIAQRSGHASWSEEWVNSPLSKRYTAPPKTIEKLRSLGRLIEQ